MFEAVLTLCLMQAPDICRDVLLPGHEAETESACKELLSTSSMPFDGYMKPAAPTCRSVGSALSMSEVAEGVFVHRGVISDAGPENAGNVSNTGFIVGEKSVAVIDTGGARSVGEELYRAVRARTDLPISHVVLTHMHPDHVLGASVFSEAGASIVGHEKLPRALQDRADAYLANFGRLIGDPSFIGTSVTLPNALVAEEQTIDLGKRLLTLRAWPKSHTGSDLTVLDQSSGILFTGDLVFHEHAPALDGSLTGWQDVLAELQDMPVSHIVPGHGGPILTWPEGGEDLRLYLELLAAETRAAIARGESLGAATDHIAASAASEWQLFDLFNPRNATVAFTELEWE